MPPRIGRWYFINGSRKDHKLYFGSDQYSILEGFDGLIGPEYKEQLFPFTRKIGSFHMNDGKYEICYNSM